MFRFDIINRLIQRTNAKRYLEIGVSGENFNRIRCAEKVSVDPNVAATYVMTSNAFFERYQGPPFDVIFIDADHRREQVLADILNALKILNPSGAVIVHDCDPPDERAGGREPSGGAWCGDVWQGWLDARLHLENRFWTGTVDADLGCGLILSWKRPQPVPHIAEGERTWAKFQAMRAEWLGLVGIETLEDVLAPAPLEEMLELQHDLMERFEAMADPPATEMDGISAVASDEADQPAE